MTQAVDKPYITEEVKKIVRSYNINYGDLRVCICGHTYYRHFDTYEDMSDAGCKYCACHTFEGVDHTNILRKKRSRK